MLNLIVLLGQTVPEGRVFGLDAQTFTDIAMQLLNGIILAVVLGYLLYNPVKNFMQERRQRIEGKIEQSDERMDKAKTLISEYENKLKHIEEERITVLEEAQESAEAERAAMREDLENEIDEIRRRAQDSLQAERNRLHEETRVHIIDNATLIAEKFISEKITQADHDRLIEDAISQLEESSW